jgi:hypothetical protein
MIVVDIGPAAEILTSDRHIPDMQLRNSCRMTFINGFQKPPLSLFSDQALFFPQLCDFHPNPAANSAPKARERGGTCACS